MWFWIYLPVAFRIFIFLRCFLLLPKWKNWNFTQLLWFWQILFIFFENSLETILQKCSPKTAYSFACNLFYRKRHRQGLKIWLFRFWRCNSILHGFRIWDTCHFDQKYPGLQKGIYCCTNAGKLLGYETVNLKQKFWTALLKDYYKSWQNYAEIALCKYETNSVTGTLPVQIFHHKNAILLVIKKVMFLLQIFVHIYERFGLLILMVDVLLMFWYFMQRKIILLYHTWYTYS